MVFLFMFLVFFFKQKTAYEMRISDWSSRRVLFRSARASRGAVVPHDRARDQAAKRHSPAPGQCVRDGAPTRGGGRDRHGDRQPFVDRKSVVSGKRVSVRVDLGGRRINKKKRAILVPYIITF